jgi:DNA-binding MarR family transcriptional regulator
MQHLIVGRIIANERIAREVGLLTVDMQTLRLISLGDGPMTASEIAATTGLPTSTVTRVIDRLEAAGYVSRVPSADDRRKTLVEVDAKRLAEVSRNYDSFFVSMAEVNSGFSTAELDLVSRYFEELTSRGAGRDAGYSGTGHARAGNAEVAG